MANVSNKKEILIKKFNELKNGTTENSIIYLSPELSKTVAVMFSIDEDIAIDMWRYLLQKYQELIHSDDMVSNTLIDSIFKQSKKEIRYRKMKIENIVLNDSVIKKYVFTQAKSWYAATSIIVSLISVGNLQQANDCIDLLYHNKYREGSIYEILEDIIIQCSHSSKKEIYADKTVYELIEMWHNRIDDKIEYAKLDIILTHHFQKIMGINNIIYNKERIIKHYDVLKEDTTYDTLKKLPLLISTMFALDKEYAIEMWKYLLQKHKYLIQSNSAASDYIINSTINSIGNDIGNIILHDEEIKEIIFNSNSANAVYIILQLILNGKLQEANNCIETLYNNKYSQEYHNKYVDSWYNVMSSILRCFPRQGGYGKFDKISKERLQDERQYKLLEFWCDKVENKSYRVKLNLELMMIEQQYMDYNKEGRTEVLINYFNLLKDDCDKIIDGMTLINLETLSEIVKMIFSIDMNIAIDMWKYLLQRYRELIQSHGAHASISASLISNIFFEGEKVIGNEELSKIILDEPIFKKTIFSYNSYSEAACSIIKSLMLDGKLQEANDCLDLLYHNEFRYSNWYEILNTILMAFSHDKIKHIDNTLYDLLDYWCDKIDDELDKFNLRTKLIRYLE